MVSNGPKSTNLTNSFLVHLPYHSSVQHFITDKNPVNLTYLQHTGLGQQSK